MKLPKLEYNPTAVLDFFQEGLESLGAVCERTWHDRLHLVAEGRAARLWNEQGEWLETEVRFPPPDEPGTREARTEVFPGCPLVFHLVEGLRPAQLLLQRAILQTAESPEPPPTEVVEKLWHAEFPGGKHWQLETPFQSAWHFSLLVMLRCEIQAIDQHWSLHRLVLSCPDGRPDEALATTLEFAEFTPEAAEPIPWPEFQIDSWQQIIAEALSEELEPDLAPIRRRQQNYLGRELERIDEYFRTYERELTERLKHQRSPNTKIKSQERLAAAQAEHERRRQDQLQRHEIRVIPHLDALVLFAEQAWSARVSFVRPGEAHSEEALFVPRARRWIPASMKHLLASAAP